MAEKANGNLAVNVSFKGKLLSVERYDGKTGPIYENLVVIPAADQFHSPTRLMVKSRTQIGRIDEMVDVTANLSSRYFKTNKGKVTYPTELWLQE